MVLMLYCSLLVSEASETHSVSQDVLGLKCGKQQEEEVEDNDPNTLWL